jgi:hypothetical protein
MENLDTTNNQVTTHIVKGLILSAFSIVFSVVMYVFNLFEYSWLSWVSTAVVMGGLIYGNILYANQNNNNVTFGNLFAHGFKTTAVLIVITTAYTVLAFKVFFPDMIDMILEISRKKMLENPQMTDEMIEQAMSMTKKFFVPFAIGGTILGTGFTGAIASLIGAGVAKKNPIDPFSNPAS